MSIATSPIPVLRGSGGTTLQADGDALALRRWRKEKRIPLQAVRQVCAEGRALAVELTAPAGTTPTVFRVRGVSAAAAAVFADAVTARLPEEREADGAALVTEGTPTESEDEAYWRKLKICAWGVGLVTVGVAVAMAIVGSGFRAFLFLILNPVTLAIAVLGLYAMRTPYYEWYLPRYGITVEAVYRGPRSYAYTDLHGTVRTASVPGNAPTRRVAYHPDRPFVEAFAAYSWIRKVFRTLFCLAFLLVGLSLFAFNIYMAVDGFQRG
ncbi:hypothetical protein DI272_43840 [Streptomyces sp. Act143]|uniref:hypothetical protein n=1 Tax=Streptomyces sp. Act143 TaxID=2200760 RepID=UPI000D684B79|nr:hypothetical protein [Streptomyces sp. Act143]PWI12600.1 hypothetical protein DI272_43840 [Streptomyces sp. Act143]